MGIGGTAERLFGGVDFVLQGLEVGNADRASVHDNELLGLKAAQVAGNQLTNGPDLRGQFLIAGGKYDLSALG